MREVRWLMRAKRWAQNPPSESRVKLFFAVLAICLLIAGIEHWVGWPDWATLDAAGRGDILR